MMPLSYHSSNLSLIALETMRLLVQYLRQDKGNFNRSFYVTPQSIESTSNTTYWWTLQMQTEWVISEPTRTHHLGLKAQNFENPIFTFWCFSVKEIYSSRKLQRHVPVAKVLLLYSFTHANSLSFQAPTYWNCHLHKRLLPDEVFQCWKFLLFLGVGFANIPLTVLISCEVPIMYSKTLKYSEQ